MRSPLPWMADVRVPTLIVEGESGFADAARNLARANPQVTLKIVPGHNHFSVVAPVVDALARRIANGEDPLALVDAELR
jgi:hypothetical protein